MTPLAALLPLSLRLALRDLRGGLKELGVLVACIMLGVAAITGVGGLQDAIGTSLERNGRELLGGDLSLSRVHVRATAAERALLSSLGTVSEVATLRAMARTEPSAGRPQQALVELKAVDPAYPLAGAVQVDGDISLRDAIGGIGAAVADPLLLARLGLELGQRIRIGDAEIAIIGTIRQEPDKLSTQATYGPRVLVSMATLEATGLIKPGSLVRWHYRLLASGLEPGKGDQALLSHLKQSLTNGGFTVASRNDPVPGGRRAVARLGQFLTLVGLAALIIGGVGVANAVGAHLQRKRPVIATLRSLGASRGQVFRVYLVQALLLAAAGAVAGILVGALIPVAALWALGRALPIEVVAATRPATFLVSGLYGLAVALLFVLWPLGRAEQTGAAALFRDEAGPYRRLPRWAYLAGTGLLAAGLTAAVVLTSPERLMTLAVCAGVAGVMLGLLLLGWAVELLARRLPRPRRPMLRVALGNVAGPQSLARPILLSLGLGLGLEAAISQVDHSLVEELRAGLSDKAPAYYFLDIPRTGVTAFEDLLRRQVPGGTVETAPMLRGRIVSLEGVPAEAIKPPPEAEWVLQGDRGLTFAAEPPEGTRIVEGAWWAKDYAGPPLVSFDAETAHALGLGLGDELIVNVLGRDITARIANLRNVEWEQLSINFVMVFSPSALAGAPYATLATITYPHEPTPAEEGELMQAVADAYPDVAAIRVKDGLATVAGILAKVLVAIRIAAGVTLLSGALVLAGAVAASGRRRIYQAVVLKVLGATSGRIVAGHLVEYLGLAAIAAVVALGLGSAAAWLILTEVMKVPFAFSLRAVLESFGLAILMVAAVGAGSTWRALAARPVPYLRAE